MFLILLLSGIFGLFYLLSGFLTDFIFALVFTAFTLPLYQRLLRFLKRPWLASISVCLVIVLVVALPGAALLTSLSAEAANAFNSTKSAVSPEKLEAFLFGDQPLARSLRRGADLIGIEYTPEAVLHAAGNLAGAVGKFVYAQINRLLANVFASIFHFLMILILVFYLLVDGPKLKDFVFRLSPLPDDEEHLLAQKFANVSRGILLGNGIGSVLQGIVGGIGMMLAGLPSPILWGTVMTITAFLPLVGISVVTIPATLYLIIEQRYLTAVLFFVGTGLASLFLENVIKTKLIGDHVQMHSMLIFLSILGGISSFGVLGILYGPLIVALFLTLVELYQRRYEKRFS